MIFIIGGSNQGAMEYGQTRVNDSSLVDVKAMLAKNFDYIYNENMTEIRDAVDSEWESITKIIKEDKSAVFVGTEMGCGVVSVNKKDRLFCELNGRINCLIAREADEVVRVFCGIPTTIKKEN